MSDTSDDGGVERELMLDIYMPSNKGMTIEEQEKPGLYKDYRLSKVVDTYYRTLPANYKKIYDSFGAGPAKPPPVQPDPPEVNALLMGLGVGVSAYNNYAEQLKAAFRSLRAADAKIAPLAKQTADVSHEAQRAMNTMIETMRKNAGMVPSGKEDDWVLKFLGEAADKAATTIEQAKQIYDSLKDEANGNTTLPKGLADRLAAIENRLTSGVADPTKTLSSSDLEAMLARMAAGNGANGKSSDIKDPSRPPGTSQRDPGQQQYPSMPTSSGSGLGMDMMSSLLPMLMGQMYNRNLADPDRLDRRYGRDPSDQDPRNMLPVVQGAPPAVIQQTPAPAPPSATDKPVNQAPNSNQAATLTPGPDGGVDYQFPDGKVQRVSVVVAKALDKAFADKKNSDAQSAYADTPAKWSDIKQIGRSVDPYELMTGDVGIWENPDRVVIVRAMGSDSEASLDLIVNGELRRYPDEISESTGDFGTFAGWAHPRGIEMTSMSSGRVENSAPGVNQAPGTSIGAGTSPLNAAPAS
ncbi:hypothetical protein ACFVUS_27195 [Nocardia sp. NPDC058058]|uniref:hypothetical protein n=1 Tax=Nocardia sp. NPDC058058 TaxID=3346317 RepID=UPI0036D7B674